MGIASISYFLPQKFCPWSLETLTVYLPYPNVIIIYNLYKHSFVLRNLFVSAYWLDVWSHCIFCIFLFWFSAHAMLCLQLADGVWLSFIKRITYLLTYLLTYLVLSSDATPYLHLATSEMWCWSGGRRILQKLSLCYTVLCTIIMVHRGTSSSYRSVDYAGLWSGSV